MAHDERPDMGTVKIDCDDCAVRGHGCQDCVVSVLLGIPETLIVTGQRNLIVFRFRTFKSRVAAHAISSSPLANVYRLGAADPPEGWYLCMT